jgi:predicted AlkP superfamily pyrophosphatase or phosphodiesterase
MAFGIPDTDPPAKEKPRPAKKKVRLVVMVVFDQFRGDYLGRWKDLYGEGGFRRLMEDGAWFPNCHYPYSGTWTGAGHASLATGCSPHTHGIVANSWYDRALKKDVNCIGAPKTRVVRLIRKEPTPGKEEPASASPARLLAPTLADALKSATGGKGKVVALSHKDRAAVLPGGKTPDACYWMDVATGEFVTSTYYRQDPHPWVARFTANRTANRWLGTTWNKLRPGLDYAKYSGPDDVETEGDGKTHLPKFPHALSKKGKANKAYYEALEASPFGNELLLALAERAVVAENLGQDDVPDLLTISFSSNDIVGHLYGPDSQEVLDTTLRADQIVQKLLDFLDVQVGRDHYALALSADHGVCPLPKSSARKGTKGDWHAPADLGREANRILADHYGEKTMPCLEALNNHDYYISRAWLKARGLKASDARKVLAAGLLKVDFVQAAYTEAELASDKPTNDKILTAARLSYYPGRSGDVYMIMKPYHLIWSGKRGTSHGSPYEFDQHVPLAVIGPGVKPGARRDAVTPQSIASILAEAAGVPAPAKCDAPVPAGTFEGK